MSDEEPSFGTFGEVRPVYSRRGTIFFILKLIFAGGFCAGLGFVLVRWGGPILSFLERSGPVIEFVSPPEGIGLEEAEFKVRLSDEQSGIEHVRVRLEQGRESETALEKDYGFGVFEDTISFKIDAKAKGYRRGRVRIEVSAFDRSLWSNGSRTQYQVNVDFDRPKIEVLTQQHNAVRGGVNLVFYRLPGLPDAFSGVTVGNYLFPGFPARRLDPTFEIAQDLYFAFFAIPLDYQEAKDQLHVIARNAVGNANSASFYYRIREQGAAKRTEEISADLFPKIEDQFARLIKNSAQTKVSECEKFRHLKTAAQDTLEENLISIFSHPKLERYWKAPFARLSGTLVSPIFGQRTVYTCSGETLGEFVTKGSFYSQTFADDVRAAEEGVVIFSDELPILGKTVVLDHGFGLTTVYAHLSELSVKEGKRTARLELLGKAGGSGLVEGVKTFFQTRLHGIPVRSIEWSDKTWMRDHVFSKLDEQKRRLGIPVVLPLAENSTP